MRRADIHQLGQWAGVLEERDRRHYRFTYAPDYIGEPVSLTLPIRTEPYEFDEFPSVFEGLLPEGQQLEALLRQFKVDRNDLLTQLLLVGSDVVGSLQVKESL